MLVVIVSNNTRFLSKSFVLYIVTLLNKVKGGGVYSSRLVRLSVCPPSVRLSVCPRFESP